MSRLAINRSWSRAWSGQAIVALLGVFLTTASLSWAETPDENMLTLNTRRRVAEQQADGGVERWLPVGETVRWDAEKTALIICDMWDDHWCQGAARRVVELAPAMNQVVARARAQGVLIIHAPSTTVDYYRDAPQRRRAIEAPFVRPPVELSTDMRWGTCWCWPDETREAVLPIDDSDMGCDCAEKCEIRDAWTRQIAAITIAPPDAISDNGQEVFNLLEQHDVENVILMGVHLNMCVLGRPFGIRQIARLGKNVVLVRDMTDTMYNSRMAPRVNHFVGTDLVVEHVEKYWCPTITSSDLTGAPPFRFAEDARK